ncbi:MAG: NAD-dependent epimerase/dehydratase family protein [Deltaproteobacteria bacterium]|nr:NAD-dependent epimerase/dehydratase family protein [Deltaproteobacteria bacterium]
MDAPKNVLVVGGSYFVGRVFVEELRRRPGYAIHVMNRGRRPLRLDGVQEIACDRHDPAAVRRLQPPREWHPVVDFCAYRPDDVARLLGHLPGTVRQYVLISTATVLRGTSALPMNEDTPTLSGPMPGPGGDYGYQKRLAELEVERCCRERGVAWICLRPPFIYGAHNYAPRESYFFELVAQGETIVVPAPPQALFSMVSVWDVAGVCIACLGNERVCGRPWIVSPDELISYDRVIETLEAASGRSLEVQRQPVRVIEAKRLPLPFPLTEHLVYSGARLRQALQYQYLPFSQGMARTFEWYRGRGTR